MLQWHWQLAVAGKERCGAAIGSAALAAWVMAYCQALGRVTTHRGATFECCVSTLRLLPLPLTSFVPLQRAASMTWYWYDGTGHQHAVRAL